MLVYIIWVYFWSINFVASHVVSETSSGASNSTGRCERLSIHVPSCSPGCWTVTHLPVIFFFGSDNNYPAVFIFSGSFINSSVGFRIAGRTVFRNSSNLSTNCVGVCLNSPSPGFNHSEILEAVLLEFGKFLLESADPGHDNREEVVLWLSISILFLSLFSFFAFNDFGYNLDYCNRENDDCGLHCTLQIVMLND